MTIVFYNKALQSDKIAGYAVNFAAERERYEARVSIQAKE